jgi:serine phosphatase RsbU (regulator of sigma subunit)
LGLITGEQYNEQSIKLNTGDMILAFSDGATEVHSPDGEELTAKGFLKFAERTMRQLPRPLALPAFSEALLNGIQQYRGNVELEDDITLLTLRRAF